MAYPLSAVLSQSLTMVLNYHREVGAADPIIQRIADEDKVPWYKKPNLRYMYFWLFITCMGVEITSGFDSQMINALQIVPSWKKCKSPCQAATSVT